MRRYCYGLFGLFLPVLLAAQGRILPAPCLRVCPVDRVCVPCTGQQETIIRTRSDVHVRLDRGVVQYEITETFKNLGARIAEAEFIFPLPGGAAFQDLKLSINGELVAGETMSAVEARRIYESIVQRQRDPALVEWMGSGLLRARIFPINPGEEKKVVIRYQTAARREGNVVRVDVRDVGGNVSNFRKLPSRLRRPNTEREELSHKPVNITFDYPNTVQFGTAYSPTHDLIALKAKAKSYKSVSIVANGANATILVPVRSSSEASLAVLTHAASANNGFAMISISPPTAQQRITPRDITVVVDVSGSMSGSKMVQAKAAVKQLLQTLSNQDRFRLIDFSSTVQSFHDDYSSVTPANVSAANRYIDGLEAQGGTNIAGALREALRVKGTNGRLPVVLFVTDGEPTVGEQDPTAIAAMADSLRGNARVFTFGLGGDVHISLLEQLALSGRGTSQFVAPNESIEHTMSVTAQRLSNPLVTGVRVRGEGIRLTSMLPVTSADIFAGQDLVVFAQYKEAGTGLVVVTGESVNGPVTWRVKATFPAKERENAFIPRLWATQRVGYLSAEKRKNMTEGRASPELDEEIKTLGERYGIPTQFSSYLVVEPGRKPMTSRNAIAGGVSKGIAAGETSTYFEMRVAKDAQEQRSAKSVSAANTVAIRRIEREMATAAKNVGDRIFLLRDSVWTDSRSVGKLDVVRVKPFSEAYFSLLAQIPDLAPIFAIGERVQVVGRQVVIELTPSGAEKLSSAVVSSVERRW